MNFAEVVAQSTGHGLTDAAARLEELAKFFRVIDQTRTKHVPSKWVDEAWHALLDQPKLYESYLRELGVDYISHIPGAPSPAVYAETRREIARLGPLNMRAWPERAVGNCSGGCSGCGGGGG